MPSIKPISCEKLAGLIETSNCPAFVNVRSNETFEDDTFLVSGSARQNPQSVAD